MQLTVCSDYQHLSDTVADQMIALLRKKPTALICMASGSSPKGCSASFVEKLKAGEADASSFFFIGLDEWVGLPPQLPGSCAHDFETRLFQPLAMPSTRYHLFNGLANDLQQECLTMDRLIAEKGGIDLAIVGIGLNGHIGFNEPGSDPDWYSHVAALEAGTISTGQQKYFSQPVQLEKGITIGLAHLRNARQVILIANGDAKASIIKRAVQGPVHREVPASILQQWPHAAVLLDSAAAARLQQD